MSRITTILERNRKACLAIRNRVYPKEVWPGQVYLQELLREAGDILVELGCGREGEMLCRAHDRFRLKIGLDPDVRQQFLNEDSAFLLSGDAATLPFPDASVDVVAMANVAEHLPDPQVVFNEVARTLRPGGRFIVLTVNKFFPPILAARVLPHWVRVKINRIVSGTAEEDTFPAVYRANSITKLRALANSAQLDVIQLTYVPHHPTYLLFSPLVYRAGVVLEQIVRHNESLAWLRHMLLAVFRKPQSRVYSKT